MVTQFIFQGIGIRSRCNDAFALAPFDVEVEAVEPHGVGARARPVHILEPVAALRLAVLQREIPILMQPRVEIHTAGKRFETVIRDNHEQCLVIDLLHDTADECIHASVEFLNHLRMLIVRNIAGGWMILVEIAPEHVLHPVGRIEHAGTQALLRFL